MSSQVVWAKRALGVASRLDRPTRERILQKVEDFAETGQGDVKRLKGPFEGLYRLRVGIWRVFLSQEEDYLIVRAVRPRGDAY